MYNKYYTQKSQNIESIQKIKETNSEDNFREDRSQSEQLQQEDIKGFKNYL